MGKIGSQHLSRKACLYIRQSSLAQVEHHRESGARQYSLRERAVTLGWPAEQIEVIDEDQGLSGASAVGRTGFQRMVSDVALGRVGAVLGLEVSRLARSCADWYRLLEVAALAGTLIVDEEGVYDPNHYNDRLLLGLKGTLSEAELHFLKQRMIGGRRNKARRGEYRIRLPVGYVWEQGVGIRMDPDERVRDTVHLFFRCFERLGTAAAVARHFEGMRQPFPKRDGWGNPEVAVGWGTLSWSRAVEVLRSPIYAGIYAYARKAPDAMDPEDPCSGGRILIRGTHPGYITGEQYERNLERLAANRSIYGAMRAKGNPREGRSLLQGIVLCGRCGRTMRVTYRSEGTTTYECRGPDTRRLCQQVHGRYVDPMVEEHVLGAVSREQLDLALGALEKLAERSREIDQQWKKRVEGAHCEADRAARRYHQVEPENRLVARTLEQEWNTRLAELARVEREYAEAQQRPPIELTDEQRRRILLLANDLPRLWRAPTTRPNQRKELMRMLVEDVTVRNTDVPWATQVAIRWRTGLVERHHVERVLPHPQTTPAAAVERIKALYGQQTDREIARILNSEGYHTGYGKAFTELSVSSIRQQRGLLKSRVARNPADPMN